MTRLSKRNLERRLEQADPETETEYIVVVSIDSDQERIAWLTPAEYEQEHGERPESEFNYHINYSDNEA